MRSIYVLERRYSAHVGRPAEEVESIHRTLTDTLGRRAVCGQACADRGAHEARNERGPFEVLLPVGLRPTVLRKLVTMVLHCSLRQPSMDCVHPNKASALTV